MLPWPKHPARQRKNYLYFAERWGAEVRREAEAWDIRPLPAGEPGGARYEVLYRRSTTWLRGPVQRVRARNVIVAAGVLGTLRLLFRCRDETRSLPLVSRCLGEQVRTNSEALLGVTSRDDTVDYSQGITITSLFRADDATHIQPVRFPAGSSAMRLLAAPLVAGGKSLWERSRLVLTTALRHPLDLLRGSLLPDWARRTTILLVMQTEDCRLRLRLGRSLLTLFRRALVAETEDGQAVPASIDVGHRVTRAFAGRVDGIAAGAVTEELFNMPTTAHILGGCPFGRSAEEGVIDLDCQVFNYPGLYVVDGSIMPANPGINPSLTIVALAEYATSRIPPRDDATPRHILFGAAPEQSLVESNQAIAMLSTSRRTKQDTSAPA